MPFSPIGLKRTLVFRAINLGLVHIIITTEPRIVVVAYLMSTKKVCSNASYVQAGSI